MLPLGLSGIAINDWLVQPQINTGCELAMHHSSNDRPAEEETKTNPITMSFSLNKPQSFLNNIVDPYLTRTNYFYSRFPFMV